MIDKLICDGCGRHLPCRHCEPCSCREAMFADLVDAARQLVVYGPDGTRERRIAACLARIDGRDSLDLFRPGGA